MQLSPLRCAHRNPSNFLPAEIFLGLAEYKRKRNFKDTAEPAEGGERGKRVFVLQPF